MGGGGDLEAGSLTTPAFGADERASIPVPFADRPSHGRGHIARGGFGGRRRPRAIGAAELDFLELFHEHGQCPIDNRRLVGAEVAWRSRSFARRSFSRVSTPMVTCSL